MEEQLTLVLENALTQVLNETGCRIEEKLQRSRDPGSYEIVISIGVTGDLSGTMMLKTSLECGEGIASLMLGKISQEDEVVKKAEDRQLPFRCC